MMPSISAVGIRTQHRGGGDAHLEEPGARHAGGCSTELLKPTEWQQPSDLVFEANRSSLREEGRRREVTTVRVDPRPDRGVRLRRVNLFDMAMKYAHVPTADVEAWLTAGMTSGAGR
jgi:hypothetical protein